MVRLADLSESELTYHLDRIQHLPEFPLPTLVSGPEISCRRVAIISTAGLHHREDRPFDTTGSGMDYRVIPAETQNDELVMSHVSVNFDRTGFQSDCNVVFPLDRLKDLANSKFIGSIAKFHYSFMGAIWPITRYESKVRELATLLKHDQVDAVILSPV